LKADVHHAYPVRMFVDDTTIVSRTETARPTINWNEWHGDKVIYRKVTPGRINWPQLPEIVVLLEPIIGERVIYNPFAAANPIRTEVEARERVGRIWQELYARQPQLVRRTVSLSDVLESVTAGLRAAGDSQEAAIFAGF